MNGHTFAYLYCVPLQQPTDESFAFAFGRDPRFIIVVDVVPSGRVMIFGRRARSRLAEWSVPGARTQRSNSPHAIHRSLTASPSCASPRLSRTRVAGDSLLAELNARSHRNHRSGAVQTVGALHPARSTPSFRFFWPWNEPRHAATAVVLLMAPSGPTSSGPFASLRWGAWMERGAIRAYPRSCVRGYASSSVPPPLCGARSLAR